MEGHPDVSSDVLAKYAGDAAREVEHVEGLVESALHRHKGVRIFEGDGTVAVELHLAIAWGANVPALGADVQRRVGEYLSRMAGIEPNAVDVVIDAVVAPTA